MEENDNTKLIWGQDRLSDYLEKIAKNTRASFDSNPSEYQMLNNIDKIFQIAQKSGFSGAEIPLRLLWIRSTNAFQASVGNVLAGQLPEAYMVVRGSLEAALYAFACSRNTTLNQTYMDRNLDETSKKACVKAFTPSELWAYIADVNPILKDVVCHLYNVSIDMGGHPNPRAILTNTYKTENSGHYRTATLNTDKNARLYCFHTVGNIGICNVELFKHVFPLNFSKKEIQERQNSVVEKLKEMDLEIQSLFKNKKIENAE